MRVDRDENLRMIADSVAFLRRRQKVVVYDAEHFFDGLREDRAYALRCLHAAYEAGAAYLVLCDTNGASLPHEIDGGDGGGRRGAAGRAIGIHCHNDAEVRRRQLARRGARRRAHGAGHDERLRRALRQREPRLDRPQPAAQDGLRCLPEQLRGLTEASHFLAELLNFTPDPNQPYVGTNAFAHKGGMHVAGVGGRPGDVRAHRPGGGRQRRASC